MQIQINEHRLVELLRQLVQINSINPTLVPGAPGEAEVAKYIFERMIQAGIEVDLQEVASGRCNVICRLPGNHSSGRKLVLNAHMDTVSAAGVAEPFAARIEAGKLFGRGALDDKAGIAVGIEVLIALKESGIKLKGEVILAAVCDEEYNSIGTEKLVTTLEGDGCIVLEATDLDVLIAHGGFVWAEVETIGVAAHGSLPDVGVDAIVKMGRLLTGLDSLSQHIQRNKAFHCSLAGTIMRPSVHASLIDGGREMSSYPDRCIVKLERRLTPAEPPNVFETELEELIDLSAAVDPTLIANWKLISSRDPWQAQQGLLLDSLDRACLNIIGQQPERITKMGWMDSAFLEQAGIPTLVFGPSGQGAHADVEFVELDSVVTCAQIIGELASLFCNPGE